MAPISPGPTTGPGRKPKKPTQTTKLHRFEPFTKRISRLKIDPVHTVERRQPLDTDSDLSQSFFRASLEEWTELNLSQTFTRFLATVTPLSENLPQILHHADRIFDVLVQSIEKQDELSLEPLLSLLAHLAHDLGQNFEKYFARTVALVAHVAASHENADVIEWSFTCLAWMFKYLSKLLVQDLRPLLEIMMPYLSSRKDYIVRFSAESLAFLLRKAALLYAKRKTPLTVAMSYLLEGLDRNAESTGPSAYEVGLMTLCVESAVGVDGQLHSSASFLVECLLQCASRTDLSTRQGSSTVQGIITGLIHQTTSHGFQPVLQVILDHVQQSAAALEPKEIAFALHLLQVVVGTRSGSRISDWTDSIHAFLRLVPQVTAGGECEPWLRQDMFATSATMLQYAPMDQLLPFSNRLLDVTITKATPQEFFSYCTMVASLGKQRFEDLLLPRLQQFIIAHWSEDEEGLCYLLENLHQDGMVGNEVGKPGYVYCSSEWETSILHRLLSLDSTESHLSLEGVAVLFRMPNNIHFPRDPPHRVQLCDILQTFLTRALNQPGVELDLRQRISLGWAFQTYLALADSDRVVRDRVSEKILRTSTERFRIPLFLETTSFLLAQDTSLQDVQNTSVNKIRNVLIQNLLSGSPALKQESLKLLSVLPGKDDTVWLSETIEIMLEILHTPYTPSQARQITMLVRRLSQRQNSVPSEPGLQAMIPLFCLGLLPQYHDQTRKEVCVVLAQVCEESSVAETVVDIVIKWLQTPSDPYFAGPAKAEQRPTGRLSAFRCTQYDKVVKECCQAFQDFSSPRERLREIADEAHRLEPTRVPATGRALALQVLSAMPALAEKRSRLIVPIFLDAQKGRTNRYQPPSSTESTSSLTLSPDVEENDWSLEDRKLFLTLFSKFVNPTVLFRSTEVQTKLMDLLTHGNGEIRRLALQALFTCKDPTIRRYETVLLQAVDEKTPSTDLAMLLSMDSEQGSIKESDRSSILPLLLRLLYGQMVARSGVPGSPEARRKSILRALFRMEQAEVAAFITIALGPLADIRVSDDPDLTQTTKQNAIPPDHLYGFLRMLLAMLETLQSHFAPYGEQVVDAVLYCVVRSSESSPPSPELLASSKGSSLDRGIKRTSLQCLNHLFEQCQQLDWSPYLPIFFKTAVSPRLENFAAESSQGVSGLMRIFSTWARSPSLVAVLHYYDDRILSVLWQCMTLPSTQKEVKIFIMEHVAIPLVNLASDTSMVKNDAAEIVRAEADGLLQALTALLKSTPPKDVLNLITSLLPGLAPFAQSRQSKEAVLGILIALLGGANRGLPPHVKGNLLLSIHSFLDHEEACASEKVNTELYDLVSSLFDYFKDRANRHRLCAILSRIAREDRLLQQTVKISEDLNAFSLQRLEEIDYDRRLRAFRDIDNIEAGSDTRAQWLPLLYNLLFFARTHDDFSIRSNSVGCLKKCIMRASTSDRPVLRDLVAAVLLPAVQKGVREDSETVRADFVMLYGLITHHLPDHRGLQDMTVLLVGNDEEASFFSNILHIQQHRRMRAIRRLVSEVEKGSIQASNVFEFFIPLLEKFIYDSSTDESAQSVKGHSISAMATMLQWVEWKQFKVLFRKYKNDLDHAEEGEKTVLKLLGHAADALHRARIQREERGTAASSVVFSHLATSLPESAVVDRELRTHFIPKLTEVVHYKDETQMSVRIPAAAIAIKLIKTLPEAEMQLLAAPIVLDVSQILRSRAQESRDAARRALSEIVVLLGPSSMRFVLKELRTSLTRGYQLHVLSFTLHTILVAITPSMDFGGVDYCLQDLVAVIMDDIFGVVGQEKENQDYISSMKEVKSRKSFDSMELLARSTTVSHLSKLVEPIETLLTGTLTTKQVRHVDELFRRIGAGLSHNPAAGSRDLLVFSYQLITAFYRQKPGAKSPKRLTTDEQNRQRFIVQLSSVAKMTTGETSPLLYKLARFALDLVRSTLQKHDDLLTAENVHGFLPIIGDALIEAPEDVKISALRLLSAIIKLPMAELEQNSALYVMEAVKVVQNSTSTNEEAAQAALKLVAAVLRERKSVKVRDSDVSDLLHRITPDIEEPDRQGVTFNFIRAVMARKFQLPEVYEVVDKIGIMMVTNQTRGARDVARGVYVHFLLEYPQSPNRWSKQQKFLVKNLDYDYPEGRQSVMEAIHQLLNKMKGESVQQLLSTLFVPILLRMANDDHEGCRELAGVLLGQLFGLADQSHLKTLLEPLRLWVDQPENASLAKVGMQAYHILLGTIDAIPDREISHIRDCISKTLQAPTAGDGDDWEKRFQALLLLSRLTKSHPTAVLSQTQWELWSAVRSALTHRHPWVQSTAAAAIGNFFLDCLSESFHYSDMPLKCSHGLRWEGDAVLGVLKSSIRILKRNEGNEDLDARILQILLFLGRCLETNGLTLEVKAKREFEEDVLSNSIAQDSDSLEDEAVQKRTEIPAMQYLIDQVTHIIRRETASSTSASLLPKKSALTLLKILLPHLSTSTLTPSITQAILLPLQHLTDPHTIPPRAPDPTFSSTYQQLIEVGHEIMEALQQKIGDSKYVQAMTEVSRLVRERREGRRTKRRIERVAEPEKAARLKKRKGDRKKERKKELGRAFQRRRWESGM